MASFPSSCVDNQSIPLFAPATTKVTMATESSPLLPFSSTSSETSSSACSSCDIQQCERDDHHSSSAIVLLHQYELCNAQRHRLILYMLVLVTYIGMVLALLAANNLAQDVIEQHYFLPFHYIEFWGASVFAITEALLIYHTATSASLLPLILVGFNVMTAILAAVLFTIDGHVFEVPSHWIEYVSQVTVTIVDFLLIGMLNQQKGGYCNGNKRKVVLQKTLAVLILISAIVKMLLYSSLIPTRLGGERSSHYVEFSGELVNGLFAFWFAVSQYSTLTRELDRYKVLLLHGRDVETGVSRKALVV